jgi:ferredoxin-thioredoxin reductase catalytic subunit/rubredoxin
LSSVTIEQVRRRAEADAKTYGYYLTPQPEMLQMFLEGLKTNEERYGYPSCPCRLATGNLEIDRDIICPCDYRDPDVEEYGACYCRLYVNKTVYDSQNLPDVPERRPTEKQGRAYNIPQQPAEGANEAKKTKRAEQTVPKKKLWYCKQCGYVVFREDPPFVCPICKAKREMFAEIDVEVLVNG